MKLRLVIEPSEDDAHELAFFKSYNGEDVIRDHIDRKYNMGTVLNEIGKDVDAHVMKFMIPNSNVVDLETYKKKKVGRKL